MQGSKEKDLEKLKHRLSYWFGTYWAEFDDVYMKPKLIYNWPQVQKEQNEVSSIINKVMEEFNQEKEAEANMRKQFSEEGLYNEADIQRHMSRDEIKYGNDSKNYN